MSHASAADRPVSVLFVCLGNICRSPLAEGVLRHLARERGIDGRLRVESAGTGAWHEGEGPDPRSIDVARRNGIALEGTARQIGPEDLRAFDWVVAMDRDNLRKVEAMNREAGGSARVCLLRDFDPDPGDGEVPDPYYGGPGGFDDVYAMIRRSLENLLDRVEDEAR